MRFAIRSCLVDGREADTQNGLGTEAVACPKGDLHLPVRALPSAPVSTGTLCENLLFRADALSCRCAAGDTVGDVKVAAPNEFCGGPIRATVTATLREIYNRDPQR